MGEHKLPRERAVSIMIATPMYGGQCLGNYAFSCIELQKLCDSYQIPIQFQFLYNESLVQRGRNTLVAKFLASEASHLFFIDSDIHFKPQDVLRMVACQKDIICGAYPRKKINWNNVKQGLVAFPDLTEEQMKLFAGDFVLGLLPGEPFPMDKPVEVLHAGTGFMCIKREVIENYIEKYPNIKHIDSSNDGGPVIRHAVFDCGINEAGEYLSEDYFMCKRAREIGYKIWLLPNVELSHIGTYQFTGSMPAVAAGMSKMVAEYEANKPQM